MIAAAALALVVVVGTALFIQSSRPSRAVAALKLPDELHTFKTIRGGTPVPFLEQRKPFADRYATSPRNADDTCVLLTAWFTKHRDPIDNQSTPRSTPTSRSCNFTVRRQGIDLVISVFDHSPLTGPVPPAKSYVLVSGT